MSKPVARDPRWKLKAIVDLYPKHHDWLVVEALVTSTSDDTDKLTIGELRRMLDAVPNNPAGVPRAKQGGRTTK